MARYGLLAGIAGMLLMAATCGAVEIVVLSETPVAEFCLPDGSILSNAYVWRRSSEGLMIMHDGGNYFLNYKLLPADWQAAYLGAPDPAVQSGDAERAAEPLVDKYKAEPLLEKVPDLTRAGREYLLREELSAEADQDVLALALLQSLIANDRNEAKRFLLTIEEKNHAIEAVERDRLFDSCTVCSGKGQLEKTCKSCNGSGKCPKCRGVGTRKSDLGKTREHCTTCRGTGICRECKGEGEFTPACPECNGAGKILNRAYCEIQRDLLVRRINAMAADGMRATVTSSSTAGIDKVLSDLPGLTSSAKNFYLSDAYTGGMDTNLLVACVMYSLLKDNLEDAKRFDLMIQSEFSPGKSKGKSKGKVLDVDDYLKPCTVCDSIGRIERDCSACGGSGKCVRCEGAGERTMELDDAKVHCTTCRGTGKCSGCGGDGELESQCQTCDGRGRLLDRQRAEIKLGILVDDLNAFAAKQ